MIVSVTTKKGNTQYIKFSKSRDLNSLSFFECLCLVMIDDLDLFGNVKGRSIKFTKSQISQEPEEIRF